MRQAHHHFVKLAASEWVPPENAGIVKRHRSATIKHASGRSVAPWRQQNAPVVREGHLMPRVAADGLAHEICQLAHGGHVRI